MTTKRRRQTAAGATGDPSLRSGGQPSLGPKALLEIASSYDGEMTEAWSCRSGAAGELVGFCVDFDGFALLDEEGDADFYAGFQFG